jgi:anaerobic selenocysteine-containing dehydrogenase
MPDWNKGACILCSVNCGLEIQVQDGHMIKIRGDRDHVTSHGYTCEKPRALDHYQHPKTRLTSPLRRRADGRFEEIDWDTAIREIAGRFKEIRSQHGGESILYYGGGGQGNHLCGGYARATRAVLGSVFASNALAQEKTGEFWVDGQLYGKTRCHTTPDFEHAEVAVLVGKNPWQSHGFPRARTVLKAIAKDPKRSLVVIDPRRTESAALADHFLQVKPGKDVYLLSALLAVLMEEDLLDTEFLATRTRGLSSVLDALQHISIADSCERSGIPESQLREVARLIGTAGSVAILEDLGIQMAPHSTLNSYLEKLLYLLTGNFGRRGTMNIHTIVAPLGGGSGGPEKSPVTGAPVILGLVPCNSIPDEILNDHSNRFRAALVESANPVHSLADSARMREAFDALDFTVVIDVVMTETARHADYILPAASQFEKCEATFFNLEYPENFFHLRKPIFEPLTNTLPEAEIHARLIRELGGIDPAVIKTLRAAAEESREAFTEAFYTALMTQPELMSVVSVLLYETLGQTLPEGLESAAAVWGLMQTVARSVPESVRRAGFEGEGPALGNALFDAALAGESGIIFSVDPWDETWSRLAHQDGKIDLAIDALLDELRNIDAYAPAAHPDFPFILAAGERRTSTANTIFRDPEWRRKDTDGALRMSPQDAEALGLSDGSRARLTTKRSSIETTVEISETLRPGHVTLPNGLGLAYPNDTGNEQVRGVAPNELTASEDRDWFAGTPWHKYVPAQIEAVNSA